MQYSWSGDCGWMGTFHTLVKSVPEQWGLDSLGGEAGRHQKCRVTARKEMKHVKASSEDEEPLNTSLFFMKAIFEEAEKEASLSLRMF